MANNKKKRNYKGKGRGGAPRTGRASGAQDKDVVGTNSQSSAPKASSALLDAAANVSFPVASGHPIRLGNGYGEAISIPEWTGVMRIPGVMRLGYLPTFGELEDWTSPLNVWGRDWFTFIRHHNSGSANYDATGLMFYGLSIRSCFDFLAWAQRVYGVTKGSYVPMNQYAPVDIVTACGADYEDIIKHMADLRFYIASFAARLKIMKVPNFRFFNEGREVLSNVYADTDNVKASFYVFSPDGFWRFHAGTTPEDTYMEVVPTIGTMTFADIVELGESLLNTVLNSEDFNIMSGDIAKAYTDCAAPSIIDEEFTIIPVYDPGVLWQIHNATYLHGDISDAEESLMTWRITQDLEEGSPSCGAMQMSTSVYYPTGSTSNYSAGHAISLCMDRLMDLNVDPNPSAVAAASRFMTICECDMMSENGTELAPIIRVASCQSEVITSMSIIDQPRGPLTGVDYSKYPTVSRFDLHPYLTSCQGRFNPTTKMLAMDSTAAEMYAGEVTNPGVMTLATKKNIDLAVMLDKFGG